MPGAYTLNATTAHPPVSLTDASVIVLASSEISMGAFGMQTQETWHAAPNPVGLPAVLAWQVDLLADERVAEFKINMPCGEPIEITVMWCYDRNNTAWTVGDDQSLWNIDLIETSAQLSQHPYFGKRTDATLSRQLQTAMGKEDGLLAFGQPSSDYTVSNVFNNIMSRYCALIRAGVCEWSPNIVSLMQRFRLFKSMVGPGVGGKQSYQYLLQAINRTQTIAVINPPSDILNAINSMESISYGTASTTTPVTTPGGAGLQWIRQKPQVALSGNNPNGPRDVTLRWIGVQQASAVLYPNAVGDSSNLWDPGGI